MNKPPLRYAESPEATNALMIRLHPGAALEGAPMKQITDAIGRVKNSANPLLQRDDRLAMNPPARRQLGRGDEPGRRTYKRAEDTRRPKQKAAAVPAPTLAPHAVNMPKQRQANFLRCHTQHSIRLRLETSWPVTPRAKHTKSLPPREPPR